MTDIFSKYTPWQIEWILKVFEEKYPECASEMQVNARNQKIREMTEQIDKEYSE